VSLVSGRVELGRDPSWDTVGSPACRPAGAGVTGKCKLDDHRVSRLHARIELENGRWRVTDLDSHNGTFADGDRVAPRESRPFHRVLRVGDTLLVPCADIRRFEGTPVRMMDGFVRGSAMQVVIAEVERQARAGTALHIHGETGTGKEGVARAFHHASPRATRPMVAVNCAAIPHSLAERLLFGAKRGAFSGADADAPGYLLEADGGTLFLDEIAELDLEVQATLLRVLEYKELLPVGASRPRKIELTLCSATNKDLRALVEAGKMRQDLYFRIATPAVTLPPLRARPEEIPALIARELLRVSPHLAPHVLLVEQCLLRPWPGNVRELLSEIHLAAQAAAAEGGRVMPHHLAATAGCAFGEGRPASRIQPVTEEPRPTDPRRARISRKDDALRQRIVAGLCAEQGNITATARRLSLYRTQLRRLMVHHGITAESASRSPGE
jgi:transcriptional regulator with GAF, ATPase, and Fis domain